MIRLKSQNNSQKIQKILIFQTAFIGDVILTTPLVKECVRAFPSVEIHFITIPASKNLLETHPDISRLWIYDKRGADRGLAGLWRMAGKLRAEKYDLVLIPHRSLRSALVCFLAGVPRRIGFNRSSGTFLFSEKIKYDPQQHEVERNISLLQSLGLNVQSTVYPEIYRTNSDRNKINDWIEQRGLSKNQRLIALAPGSIWATKRWPAEYWGKLATQLREDDYIPLLIGSLADKRLLPEIEQSAGFSLNSALGELSLRQSAELISRCRLLVSNDSAPTHIGVAVQTPVITIFGATAPRFGFYPYGEADRVAELKDLECRPCAIHGGKKCPLGHFKCMLNLKPQIVYQLAKGILDESSSG